jgi:hypothetical protein
MVHVQKKLHGLTQRGKKTVGPFLVTELITFSSVSSRFTTSKS